MSKVKMLEIAGKTVEEAVEDALNELSATIDDVEVEVLEEPSKGIFGFGAKLAKVRVSLIEQAEPLIQKQREFKSENRHEGKYESKYEPKTEVKRESVREEKAPGKISPKHSGYIEVGFDFLQTLLNKMEVDAKIEKFVGEESARFNIRGENVGALIGKHGATLDALQYLTNLTVNRDSEERIRVNVDIEGYRTRRIETLERLAYSLANRVKRSGKRMSLEPMNSYERKIIHSTLQNDRKISTFSEGDEPYRKVVVAMRREGKPRSGGEKENFREKAEM